MFNKFINFHSYLLQSHLTVRDSSVTLRDMLILDQMAAGGERHTIVEFPSIPFFNQLKVFSCTFQFKKPPDSVLERLNWVEI